MKVIEIIEKYLEDGGYDGLYVDDCCCEIDDLFPCGSSPEDCIPGYKVECSKCSDSGLCGIRKSETFCIGPKKDFL